MRTEFRHRITPSIKLYDEAAKKSSDISGVDVLEIEPESNVLIAKHPGEDGTMFATSRVRQPARYRAVLAITESPTEIKDEMSNLVNASHSKMCKYTVSSFYSQCTNCAVVSSRNKDSPDMVGLRIQDVVFEECLVYDEKESAKPASSEDSGNQTAAVQSVS